MLARVDVVMGTVHLVLRSHVARKLSKNHLNVCMAPICRCRSICKKKELDTEKPVAKRKRQRKRVYKDKKVSDLQFISSAVSKLLLILIILVTLIALAYGGHYCLLWLSDWMNEVEITTAKKKIPSNLII